MILMEPAMAYSDIVHTQACKQAFNLYLRKGVSIELLLRAAAQEHPTRLPALRRVMQAIPGLR